MKNVVDIKTKAEVNFSSDTTTAAKKVAAHLMEYKHSIDPDMTYQELILVNDLIFTLANASGLSLHELTGAPEIGSASLPQGRSEF